MIEEQPHFLDLQTAPTLKEGRDPVGKSVTGDTLKAINTGTLEGPPAPEPPPVTASPPPPAPAPTGQPAAPQAPPAPAVPAENEQPPVQSGDSERVQKRINRLFGQKAAAEERNLAYEQQIAELQGQVARLQQAPAAPHYPPGPAGQPSPYAPQAPAPDPYNPYGPADGAQPPAGDYVSRTEMQNLIQQQTMALQQFWALQNAQTSSRAVAEQEMPEIFQDPELVNQYSKFLADPTLQADPKGPIKAALMVRGLYLDGLPASDSALPAAAARKPFLGGVGSSVPSGAPQPAGADLHAQYAAALARAKQTQDLRDFANARLIQLELVKQQNAAAQ